MKWTRVLAATAVAVAAAGTTATAQMPESYRAVQMRKLELQRRVLLTMADSMPERLYADKVTPIQRDFAQQIHHVASVWAYLPRTFGAGTPPANLPDTAGIHTRAGLRAYINGAYDYAENLLRTQTSAQREAEANLFGNRMPAWQVWDEMHQHAFWTAGQIVANFRKHGMAPPGFGFF